MTSDKINIAGVLVDKITKAETLNRIDKFVSSGESNYLVTTYSEFVVFAQADHDYKTVLNQAALSLPDGIGILWAAKFLSLPLNTKSGILNTITALWQALYSGVSIIFNPKYVRSVITEQVTGSQLIFDLANLAQAKGYSLALVGGTDGVAEASAEKLKQKFPDVKINLALSGVRFDDELVKKIAQTNSDILLIAYSPPYQEKWLAQNLDALNINLGMGLGGTFDYLAGKYVPAPKFLHFIGLEWLWRLITQPWRWRRMWNAIPVFIWVVLKYKLNTISNINQ
ncbi:MAG: WecB/TagA/CpsF family glycosyltransferase [Candidatus Doudnabacteria bacterium]|nr:WecB/TagA/CpsF family glycosyltransferase [Candidatus Doudnabacteria bacterium]